MGKIKAISNGTKKDAILKKAAGLFRKKGFAASSMRELAENIGVEAPSLYNHIGSKAELLRDICFKTAQEFMTHINEVMESELTSPAKLTELVRFHVRIMTQSFDEVYVANHEWKQLPEPYRTNYLQVRRSYEKKMAGIIEAGIEEKQFKKLNPHVTVLTILSALRGVEFLQRNKKEINSKELEDMLIEHLLNGLTR